MNPRHLMLVAFFLSVFTSLMSGAAMGDIVVIPADQESWTDTGIDIDRSTKASISATGLACYDTAKDCQNGDAWTEPDGTDEIADESFVAPGLNKYALVGKLDDGDPFLVGSVFDPPTCEEQTGRLFLIHNDSQFSDNSGSYEATIGLIACDYFCAGSAAASTFAASPVYGLSGLGKHMVFFLLPLGVLILLSVWHRKR